VDRDPIVESNYAEKSAAEFGNDCPVTVPVILLARDPQRVLDDPDTPFTPKIRSLS
jgi:hypothetical protein